MLRSMFSAISGLRGNQTYMDVIGNNIANVNTTAYKSSRATFAATLAQTLRPASAPQANRGGVNPMQVGLGAGLASVDMVFAQGDLKPTGRLTDLAIEGDGFFVLSDGTRRVYSRDGSFDLGTDGCLLNPATGFKVQGWMADPASHAVDPSGMLGEITIPIGSRAAARATSETGLIGNLSSEAAVGDTVVSTMDIYDSLGNMHTISMTFTKAAATNTWTWAATVAAPADIAIDATPAPTGTLTFDTSGNLTSAPTVSIAYTAANGAADGDLAIDFASLTQRALSSEVKLTSQNGTPPGSFTTFTIDKAGLITGIYSNGAQEVIGQIALASFANPGGLMQAGNNVYEVSPNSSDPVITSAGNNGVGSINSFYLESANVDLAQQFTDLIIASRGFQANSRVVTTADEMLQELVNLKR